MSPHLNRLGAAIACFADDLDKEEERVELASAAERCISLALSLDSWLNQSMPDSVYWTELAGKTRQRMKLVCCPIEVGPILRDELFNRVDSVIMTSATLAIGEQNFDFFKTRIGLTQTDELKLGSPFDYKSQVKLILTKRMPDPAGESQRFEELVCEKVKRHVGETRGRAFVLFTSYRMLRNCAGRLNKWFAENNLAVFCQGEELPRSLMLERFRNADRAVLFGTESFWQGVDVPGEALQNVIIVKLPFSVPDHPLLEARIEAIRQNGGNPFFEFQLPEAVIKFKQGFGRLIRSKTDTGRVVVLDPRIQSRRYGRLFIQSLPECELIIDHE